MGAPKSKAECLRLIELKNNQIILEKRNLARMKANPKKSAQDKNNIQHSKFLLSRYMNELKELKDQLKKAK
ncbi:hypothetical protein [Millionella massiliensis]|uniref:hypothetical protein n=1 Tax=Millionella massiliensis TaxID=1871023 RepID=UPI00115FB5B8|nr:hypothetical protein [Millionella massiliensis]